MATTRKRSSGFSQKDESEEARVEELLEEVSTELFEIINEKEEAALTIEPPVKAFVEESIIPTEDVGPRFLGEKLPALPVNQEVTEPKVKSIRRHPRNTPKFSRTK